MVISLALNIVRNEPRQGTQEESKLEAEAHAKNEADNGCFRHIELQLLDTSNNA